MTESTAKGFMFHAMGATNAKAYLDTNTVDIGQLDRDDPTIVWVLKPPKISLGSPSAARFFKDLYAFSSFSRPALLF